MVSDCRGPLTADKHVLGFRSPAYGGGRLQGRGCCSAALPSPGETQESSGWVTWPTLGRSYEARASRSKQGGCRPRLGMRLASTDVGAWDCPPPVRWTGRRDRTRRIQLLLSRVAFGFVIRVIGAVSGLPHGLITVPFHRDPGRLQCRPDRVSNFFCGASSPRHRPSKGGSHQVHADRHLLAPLKSRRWLRGQLVESPWGRPVTSLDCWSGVGR